MDQNQTQFTDSQSAGVDNDLQKAIDDITSNTNVDPVFSDPVAAPSSIPEGDTGELGEPVGPFPEPPKLDDIPAPVADPTISIDSMNIPEVPTIDQPMPDTAPASLTTNEVKKAALRDLIPLLDKVTMDSTQKFNVYRDIFDELKDYTVLEPAYQAARDIPDETKRAEALLYLVEAIDQM